MFCNTWTIWCMICFYFLITLGLSAFAKNANHLIWNSKSCCPKIDENKKNLIKLYLSHTTPYTTGVLYLTWNAYLQDLINQQCCLKNLLYVFMLNCAVLVFTWIMSEFGMKCNRSLMRNPSECFSTAQHLLFLRTLTLKALVLCKALNKGS